MININELKFDQKGLIPAVVVDAITKKVLWGIVLAMFGILCRLLVFPLGSSFELTFVIICIVF